MDVPCNHTQWTDLWGHDKVYCLVGRAFYGGLRGDGLLWLSCISGGECFGGETIFNLCTCKHVHIQIRLRDHAVGCADEYVQQCCCLWKQCWVPSIRYRRCSAEHIAGVPCAVVYFYPAEALPGLLSSPGRGPLHRGGGALCVVESGAGKCVGGCTVSRVKRCVGGRCPGRLPGESTAPARARTGRTATSRGPAVGVPCARLCNGKDAVSAWQTWAPCPLREGAETAGSRYFFVGCALPLPPVVTWLILPVVICLSQRLSHACLSINASILWNCEWLIKSVIVYLMVPTTWITVVILELIHAESPDFWKGCIY